MLINKKKFKTRIILGTANFSKKYGVSQHKIYNKEVKKILHLANNNRINKIDTAVGYLSKKNIFKHKKINFKFYTKILPDKRWTSLEFCQKKLEEHFEYLNVHKVEALLFHDIKIFYNQNGVKIFENLDKLKKKNYFKKIGFSIYDIECLKYLSSNYNFDVVQCPYNILDKRIVTSGWLDKLKKRGVETHIRSVFLQGLLVNDHMYKKRYFKKWDFFFKDWFNYLYKNKISPIDYCLTDVLNYDFDKIIIGINNAQNLNEVINFKTIDKKKIMRIKLYDKQLIDPRKWN